VELHSLSPTKFKPCLYKQCLTMFKPWWTIFKPWWSHDEPFFKHVEAEHNWACRNCKSFVWKMTGMI
jgi:hypothetical protein